MNELFSEMKNSIKCPEDFYKCHDILYNFNDNKEWLEYCGKGTNKNGYYKNLIYTYNDSYISYDIYIITWIESNNSPIHDHPENGCYLKILKGKLLEELYTNNNSEIQLIKTNVLTENNISLMKSNKVLHKIIPLEYTVSLHIYSPSNYIIQTYK